jgi:hypothetical protein
MVTPIATLRSSAVYEDIAGLPGQICSHACIQIERENVTCLIGGASEILTNDQDHGQGPLLLQI